MLKNITHSGEQLFYNVYGQGCPVVLIHGFAEDNTIWKHQLDYLQGRFRLLIPDLPGSGMSALTDDVSMEGLADAVKAILDEEQITGAILIGHSMGGYVTLAFAEQYPELLKGFGLFHSTAYADSEEKKLARIRNIEFIVSHGTPAFLKQSTPVLFSDNFKEEHPEVVSALITEYSNFSPASLTRYYEAMIQRPDRTGVLKQFVKPVLSIIGKHDNAIPFKHSLEICHMSSLSYIHILENSGHMGMIEEADKSNSFLLSYLKDIC